MASNKDKSKNKVQMEDTQVVAFKLKNEEYGISILNVQEIKNLTDITRVPFTPPFVKGVMNLRGSVLPVIDLKKRLGLQDTPYTDATRIVILTIDDIAIGVIVDAVTETITIDGAHIDSSKAVSDSDRGRFIKGIGNVDGRLIIILNLDEVVSMPNEEK